ncbi:ABC transporter permease [Flavobacteriales bacterium]|nr:ABC transporter permease [Flavobacteriales bacterium]
MNIFKLSFKNIFHKPVGTVLSIVLLTLAVGIISILIHVNASIENQMNNNLKGIDMVVGAKGSPLQLILSSVYHVDSPTGNISLADANSITRNRMVKNSTKLSFGDNYKGFKIVGTEKNFLELYKCDIEDGRIWKKSLEAVVGNKVAEILELKTGDEFTSSHGLGDYGESHEDSVFKVVGILETSNSVADQLILTSLESVWDIHKEHDHDHDEEHDHDHDEEHDHDHDEEHDHDHDEEHDHDHDEEHDHDHDEEHDHGEDSNEITSILVKFDSPMNIISFPRYINEETNMQAAVPSYEISRLFKIFGIGFETLTYLAYLIMFVSGLSLFLNLLNSLKERKYEMALIRTIGGTKVQTSLMLFYESIILCIIGFIGGIILSRVGILVISNLLEESLNYSISIPLLLSNQEILLLIFSISIGILACLIPAVNVYNMNISKTLSDE